MTYRYSNRGVYKNLGNASKRPTPLQYVSPNIAYPSPEDLDFLSVETYTWQHGDKFWKIDSKYYGDPRAWWVIPWFNKKPLEADWRPGDIVELPSPLIEIYQYIY